MISLHRSIKFRLISAVMLLVFLLVALFAIFTLHQNLSFFNESLKRDAQAIISPFHTQLSNSLPRQIRQKELFVQLGAKTYGAVHFPQLIESHSNLLSVYFTDTQGERLFSSGSIDLTLEQLKIVVHEYEAYNVTPYDIGQEYTAVIAPFVNENEVIAYSTLIFSTKAYDDQHDKFLLIVVGLLIFASIVGFIGAYWLGNKITRPVISLANYISNPDKSSLDTSAPTKDEVGVLVHRFVEMQQEIDKKITELNNEILVRTKAEEQIQSIAFYDVLTELPNRHLLNDRLHMAIEQAKREDSKLAVIFIDLDSFKLINDLYGHPTGDSLLRVLSERLRKRFRSTDTIARFGGDEFVAVVPMNAYQALKKLTDDLVSICSDVTHIESHSFSVSVSVGVALYPQHGSSATELLKNSDIAMYSAKSRGGGISVMFEDSMLAEIGKNIQCKNDLIIALKEEQFELHYQPILDLRTKIICDVEVLIRWKHPEKGLLFPNDFIDVAEESGLIVEMGSWVLGEACRQFQCWKSTIQGNPLKNICINVSPKQVEQDSFISTVEHIINTTGIDPCCIKLELTENILMIRHKSTHDKLKVLRRMGVGIAIDDFGTGYSSLSYLWQFPVTVLKIDRSFVDGCSREKNKIGILKAIIGIAKTLSLSSIAEGIETEEDCRIVEKYGCQYGQGYLFSRPVSASRLEAYIENNIREEQSH